MQYHSIPYINVQFHTKTYNSTQFHKTPYNSMPWLTLAWLCPMAGKLGPVGISRPQPHHFFLQCALGILCSPANSTLHTQSAYCAVHCTLLVVSDTDVGILAFYSSLCRELLTSWASEERLDTFCFVLHMSFCFVMIRCETNYVLLAIVSPKVCSKGKMLFNLLSNAPH